MRWIKNRFNQIVLIILIVIVAGGVIFYFTRPTQRSVNVIYVCKTEIASSDFWSSVLAGAEMAAKENNVNLEFMCPTDELHTEVQKQMVYDAIKKNPDVIAVSVSSQYEITEALRAVKAAGIGLIIIDSKAAEDVQDCVVSTDNLAAGRKMADMMLRTLDENSKIAIVAHVKGSSTCVERIQGLMDGLGKYQEQIVDVVYSNAMSDIGYEVTMDLLERHPDIGYLACTNEDSAVGAARALVELGLDNKIVMVGFDSSTEEVIRLEEGVIDGIVVQKAFSMGYFGIENAAKYARGEKIPSYIDSGSALITRENMYDEANQEALFPFH